MSPWNVPNALSLARLPLAAVFPLALARPALALAVLAVAGATDVIDGWWARSRGQVTTLGTVLDPITDKAFVGAVVATLVVVGRLPWYGVVCLTTREIGEAPLVVWLLVSRKERERRSSRAGANVFGKLVTALQFACVVLVIAAPDAGRDRVLFGVTAAFGVVAAVSYWVKLTR